MENNYIDTLEKLMKEKRKSDVSQQKKNIFYNNWLKLATHEGFNSTAELYFYTGFSFCGAEPLKQYILESAEPNKALEEFFNGGLYGKDAVVTFKAVTHLLALFLNSGNNPEIISKLIEKFSISCRTKENKPLGTAKKTLEKYFLEVLNFDANLIPLSALEIKPSSAEIFIELMNKFLSDFNNKKALKVKAWLENSAEENPPTEKPATRHSASNILSQVLKNVIEIEKQNAQFQNDNVKLQNLLSEKNNELQNCQQKICELEKNLESLKAEISQKDKTINEQKIDIADYVKIVEILQNEQDSKANAALHKISSKLKVEYQDFQDALNIPMSCELGENLKQQLKNIFKELARNGVKFS